MRSLVRFLIPAVAVASVAFAPIGSIGASATTPNVAAGQPAQWVTEAYTVPVAIPIDGDGRQCPSGATAGSCASPQPKPSYGFIERRAERVPLQREVVHRAG